ncbi:uncharacterized protein BT62DRAFT_985578 [Guyanagaster necrorhizus]|uniref:Uncharacterized protein n=1 Tax=Guyanagaster necrorhizus TaxID=856835 RepID=A0A9P7VYT4_9AGAR|nr:uncharacterized protein BT62DRAFT_985578 [Guyanagaster necrorhizus MCA 3950]KAG7449230.1 hypothetical protein BT62DRAFT_985578 [Guyanagaster necrorhizus MCA 3950]
MMSAAFSRLQLAAALLEYDNDPTNPDAPYRSAHESALFAHLRRNVRPSAVAAQRRSTNHIGVSLPSEGASGGGRESVLDGRRSRGSTFALRNPFGADDYYEEEEHEEEHENGQEQAQENLEMDLTSWGLEAFISKEKTLKDKGKGKETNLYPLSSVSSHIPHQTSPTAGFVPRPRPTRSLSVGDFDHFIPSEDTRRKSIASPLDLADLDASPSVPFQRHRAASFALDNEIPSTSQNIPFPSKSIRSPSPPPEEDLRAYSTPSLKEDGGLRERTASNGSMTSRFLEDDNPFALQPPSRSSKFDPKAAAHARTTSNASMGSRMLLENDGASVMTKQTGQNRYSTTIDLLRPRVLVMPSPLQPLSSDPQLEPDPIRDGFHLSTDGPPLPPGARSARDRKASSVFLDAVPIASNSFTPNPRMNLSASQMIFRNTLKVDGERDPTYVDFDRELPRATEEGQQVFLDPPSDDVTPGIPAEDAYPPGRPAGKLYGKSLIDDLENRKAVMRSKQRVFKGDDRPSMMARGPVKRSSTLIDPAALSGDRPATQRMSSYLSDRSRPESMGPKPLLNFEGEKTPQGLPPVKLNPNAKMPNARTVFGVDTLWEKEMAKLKQIEAQEKLEAEERERREAMATNKKKKKGKDKDVPTPYEQSEVSDTKSPLPSPSPVISTSPPVLPVLSPAIHGPPPVIDDDSESEASDHVVQRLAAKKDVQGWYEDSSDEEGPLRTTGVGPRYRRSQASSGKPAPQFTKPTPDSDSEDDLPLSATINRAAARLTHLKPDSGSEEENEPLSVLLRKSQSVNSLLPKIDFDRAQPAGDEDEDDRPLGLRASHVAPSSVAHSSMPEGGDDDDRPLAFHPEQQRRTQYQMMAQQQMLIQAQHMQNGMFFNPSMMGSQFFGPPVAAMNPMMMQPPMQIPSPPPMQDPTKFGRVDRWRRDVAVEGE